jgi:hypothetical protein
MADTDPLDAGLAAIRDRTSHILAVASPSPDLMRANEAVHNAVAVLLARHSDEPVYLGAGDCGCPEDAGWEDDHPLGGGDVGRICKKAEVGRFCPACREIEYGDDAPPNCEEYASAPCSVRTLFAAAIMGEREPSAI